MIRFLAIAVVLAGLNFSAFADSSRNPVRAACVSIKSAKNKVICESIVAEYVSAQPGMNVTNPETLLYRSFRLAEQRRMRLIDLVVDSLARNGYRLNASKGVLLRDPQIFGDTTVIQIIRGFSPYFSR